MNEKRFEKTNFFITHTITEEEYETLRTASERIWNGAGTIEVIARIEKIITKYNENIEVTEICEMF